MADKSQKGAVAQRTPASLSPGSSVAQPDLQQQASQLSQYKVVLSGNVQILQAVVTRKGEKDSPFTPKLDELSKQIKDLSQNNLLQVMQTIYTLREQMSQRYGETIQLMEEYPSVNELMQLQTPGLNVGLGLQVLQQAVGPRITQAAFNENITLKVNDHEMYRQELQVKLQRKTEEIAELRSNQDKANDKQRVDYEKLQKKNDTMASENIEMRSSINILKADNENLQKELLHNEKQMKKMGNKIKELEIEKNELEDELSSVKKDVRSLKSENKKLHEAIHQLVEQNETMNQSLSDQKSQIGIMMSMMSDMTEKYRTEKEAGEVNEKQKALISLGQAATNFVNKVYEKVHPNLYKKDLIYTFDDIENHISLKKYKKSQTNMDSARQRWDEIQQNMATNAPEWQGTIRHLKQQRNNVAHPDVKPEEARSCLTLLHENDCLDDDTYQEMGCIIEIWQNM